MYTFISYVEKSFEALVKILKDLNRGAEKGFVLGLHKQYAQLFLVEGIKMGLRKFLPRLEIVVFSWPKIYPKLTVMLILKPVLVFPVYVI